MLCPLIKRLSCVGMAVVVLFLPTFSWSHGSTHGKLTIDHPYGVVSQVPPAVRVYFREFANRGRQTYRLIGAQTTVANQVTLQTETHTPDHVIQWVSIESITIKPKAAVLFRHHHEQGYRIELTDLVKPLKDGDKFDLTLIFEDGERTTVDVWIQTPRLGKKPHAH